MATLDHIPTEFLEVHERKLIRSIFGSSELFAFKISLIQITHINGRGECVQSVNSLIEINSIYFVFERH